MFYGCGFGPHCKGCACADCDALNCTIDLPSDEDVNSGACWTDECSNRTEDKSSDKHIPEALYNRLILHLKANLSDMATVNSMLQGPHCSCCGTPFTCTKCGYDGGQHGYTLMESGNKELLDELEKI